MAVVEKTDNKEIIDTSLDGVVIISNLGDLPGGRTLDTTGFADTVIQAGHVIIKETSTGEYKPLPVNDTLPASHSYEGVLAASVLKSKPFASIMTRGDVRKGAMKYPAKSGAISALSLIKFLD